MITIANANALHIPLPDQSVQCIVTSPPYYGLRDYGTAKWEGGSAECDHVASERYYTEKTAAVSSSEAFSEPGEANKARIKAGRWRESGYCVKCGARRIDAQIGLEASPAAYVANIVTVMRECWRVLKDDGVMWLNLGDSYARAGGWSDNSGIDGLARGESGRAKSNIGNGTSQQLAPGLKSKDLIGIPWRVAFSLQDDGWYLRQDIIWHKPNPMPESVTDRCTKAHEYIFLLTKQARYFYDNVAIQEEAAYDGRKDELFKGSIKNYDGVMPDGQPQTFAQNGHARWNKDENGNRVKNKRSVWTVATQPYSGAHFATFPPALIEPMILAGSRRGDVVLDPFAGSGTTGAVAVKHGRRAVLLDLNTKYIDLQFERTNGVQITMPFETIAPNSPSNDVAR